MNENISEKEKQEEAAKLFRQVLAADEVVRVKFLKGELDRKEASELGGRIAIVMDGIILGALGSQELAEEIVPALAEKVQKGMGNPLAYTHMLQFLAFRHQLDIEGVSPNPKDIPRSVAVLRDELDLESIEEQRAELVEEAREKIAEFKGKWQNNQMFR